MNVKRLAALAVLIPSLLIIASGCGFNSRVLGQTEPTLPPTRTPRPTFTPRPVDTDTPVPTDTPAATDTPQPTDTPVPPTKAPVKATAKPRPTQPPAQPTLPPAPTQPPAPTASPYEYSYVSQTCEHSGGTYIKVVVYSNYHDPNSLQAGVKVRLSWQVDGPAIADVVTDGNGESTFVLAGDGQPAKTGTYYAWILKSGTRDSDMSAPIVINGKNENASDSCWLAHVFFAAGK